jgi:TolB protein
MRRMMAGIAAITAVATILLSVVPAGATPPGVNGRLVFRRYFNPQHTHGALFTINPDGSGLFQVTHPGRGVLDNEPDWSADGQWIVYERNVRNGPTRLFKIHPDGTGRTALSGTCTGNCVFDADGAFSPDGTRIAFARVFGAHGKCCFRGGPLFVMDADGTQPQQVTQQRIPLATQRYDDSGPQWSPDGTRLVFERYDTKRDKHAICTVRLDGSDLRRLTPWTLDAGDHPDWSPDGRWILFHSNEPHRAGTQDNVFLIHPNGTGMHRITHTFGDHFEWLSSSFSPDGTMITVSRYPGHGKAGNADVYVMNVDGSDLRDVTNSFAWDSATDWGPEPS